MKRLLLAIVAVCTMTVANAQSSNSQQKPPKMDAATMAQKQTDKMTKDLGLSSDQATKVLALNKKYAGKIGPMGGGPGRHGKHGQCANCKNSDGTTAASQSNDNSRPQLTDAQKKEMDAKMKEDKANRDAYNKELKAILSSDQYSTYEKCMNNCNGGKHKGCKNCDKHK